MEHTTWTHVVRILQSCYYRISFRFLVS